jgi:hypothetical protein
MKENNHFNISKLEIAKTITFSAKIMTMKRRKRRGIGPSELKSLHYYHSKKKTCSAMQCSSSSSSRNLDRKSRKEASEK